MRTTILTNLFTASTLVAALSGCGQSPGPDPSGQLYTPLTATAPRRDPRIMPIHRPDESGAIKTAPTAAKLEYYGGPVLTSVKVVPVYWGTGTMMSATDMHGFYDAVTKNPYIDWLSEYDTNISPKGGGTGTNQHIGRGSVDAKDYPITPSITSKSLSDTDVQTELSHQISTKVLPAPDANTIYMVHFPLGTSIDLGGSGSCSAFCAYHSTFVNGTNHVYYSVLPYMGTGSGCEGGCGTAAKLLDNQTSVSSHELIETVTDADIGLVTGSIGKPAAWYDSTNGEIGDICNAEQGTLPGTSYTIQKEWSNKQGACVASGGTCTKNCTGKVCGDDGCGGSCGTCAAGKSCNASGQCVPGCVPSCTGKACGDNGCGGSCGTCPAGDSCNSSGMCVPSCVPACTGKTCGSDGCGGTCGTCPSGDTCSSSGVCVGGSTCTHDKCKTGKKLKSSCDPCVTQICDFDSYCCSNKWDATCVSEVADVCGETC